MPQKRNLDLFELLRGRSARFLGLRTGLAAITLGLPSGYSRDLQDTKALCIEGLRLVRQGLAVTTAAVPTLEPVTEKILAALTPDIYATDEAYRLVREQGMTFRDAYIQVGRNLDQVKTPDHHGTVRSRTHLGSTGNLGLDGLDARRHAALDQWETTERTLTSTWESLLV
jgi:argininosuccinate lyase